MAIRQGAILAPAGESAIVVDGNRMSGRTEGEDVARLPLIEERATVQRRLVETGRVRLRVLTETEDRQVQAALRSVHVEVTRVPVGRELADGEAAPVPREEQGGALLILPVLEEVLHVETRQVLREELHIRRSTTTETATTHMPLRRQHAEVERQPINREDTPA